MTQPPTPARALTATELAQTLGVSRYTIARAVRTGRLDGWRPVRINARVRFVPADTAASQPVETPARG